jgi:hypothetical protein
MTPPHGSSFFDSFLGSYGFGLGCTRCVWIKLLRSQPQQSQEREDDCVEPRLDSPTVAACWAARTRSEQAVSRERDQQIRESINSPSSLGPLGGVALQVLYLALHPARRFGRQAIVADLHVQRPSAQPRCKHAMRAVARAPPLLALVP